MIVKKIQPENKIVFNEKWWEHNINRKICHTCEYLFNLPLSPTSHQIQTNKTNDNNGTHTTQNHPPNKQQQKKMKLFQFNEQQQNQFSLYYYALFLLFATPTTEGVKKFCTTQKH